MYKDWKQKLDLLQWSQLRKTQREEGLKSIDRALGILWILTGTGLGTKQGILASDINFSNQEIMLIDKWWLYYRNNNDDDDDKRQM